MVQPSLRDVFPVCVVGPWVETHGYVQEVAPRLGFDCRWLPADRNPRVISARVAKSVFQTT